jgi:hypothetical protein
VATSAVGCTSPGCPNVSGVKWIGEYLKTVFQSAKEIFKYYHCSLCVHQVAKVQYQGDEYDQVMLVESVMTRLNFGEVENVILGFQ